MIAWDGICNLQKNYGGVCDLQHGPWSLGHAETIKYEKTGITYYVRLHAGDRLSEDMNQKTCKEVGIPFYVGLKIAYFLNPNYLMTI